MEDLFFICIDNLFEFGGIGILDGDGCDELIIKSGVDYDWYVYFDLMLILDGVIEVYYIVFDSVGNGIYYCYDVDGLFFGIDYGFIKNNLFVISLFIVGIDFNFDGLVIFVVFLDE